jgi:hypothetical protein
MLSEWTANYDGKDGQVKRMSAVENNKIRSAEESIINEIGGVVGPSII